IRNAELFFDNNDVLHADIGLAPVPENERFYTKELHKQAADFSTVLPEPVQQLYQQLEQIAAHYE
ncbi:MAG TPA: hypothetical protein PKH01_01495, partial [Pseudomonadales bacterium]|nr:hypothetical protein [Pseudomonadales bacterium]